MTKKTTTTPTASTEPATIAAVTPSVDPNRFAPLVRLQSAIAFTWANYMVSFVLILSAAPSRADTSGSAIPSSIGDAALFAGLLLIAFLAVSPFLIASSAFTAHAAATGRARHARTAGILMSIPGTGIAALTLMLSPWLIPLIFTGPIGWLTASALALSSIFTIRFWTLYRAATRPARTTSPAPTE